MASARATAPSPGATADGLEALRRFAGAPEEFWRAFLREISQASGAQGAVAFTRTNGSDWRIAQAWPEDARLVPPSAEAARELDALASTAAAAGSAIKSYPAGAAWIHLAAIRLAVAEGEAAAILRFDRTPDTDVIAAAARVQAVAELPLVCDLERAVRQARADAARFAQTLDLLVLLNEQTRFTAAAILVCNELAARFGAARASLGWLEGRYVRLRAMSHVEKFGQKMNAVRALELAMEEALDQDEEIVWPPAAESAQITRDHDAYARREGVAHLVSVPLRLGPAPIAVLSLERAGEPFSTAELAGLRLTADQITRRLADLQRHDRWFGARWATAGREAAAKLVGLEHTAAKLLALAGAVALAVLVFGQGTYRVQAPFTLRCDTLAQLPAPFDGYLSEVRFRIGDHVTAGQPLLALDTRELLVQQAASLAEYQRHQAEAQKAESGQNIAEMRIASAAAEEARARLELVEHRLQQALVLAPFEGVVVEGDLREKIAAPVRQGDTLLQVARLEAIYPEIEVPERSVQEIADGARGELAFATRPGARFRFTVERVEPAAEVTANGNVFIVRARFEPANEPWWRPGMTGEARIDAGRRSWLWIFTHRTLDYLRLRFWW